MEKASVFVEDAGTRTSLILTTFPKQVVFRAIFELTTPFVMLIVFYDYFLQLVRGITIVGFSVVLI